MHSATRPLSGRLIARKAFSGKHLPKDLKALTRLAEELGYEPRPINHVDGPNMRVERGRGTRKYLQ